MQIDEKPKSEVFMDQLRSHPVFGVLTLCVAVVAGTWGVATEYSMKNAEIRENEYKAEKATCENEKSVLTLRNSELEDQLEKRCEFTNAEGARVISKLSNEYAELKAENEQLKEKIDDLNRNPKIVDKGIFAGLPGWLPLILGFLGFVGFPRLTIIIFMSTYITHHLALSHVFLPVTIWFAYEQLNFGLFSKFVIATFWLILPRTLMGLLGLEFHDASMLWLIVTIIGFVIDIKAKFIFYDIYFRQKEV